MGDVNVKQSNGKLLNGKVKHRRAKSVARAEDIQLQELKARRSQPDKPYVFRLLSIS